jgi:hypothetical protein
MVRDFSMTLRSAPVYVADAEVGRPAARESWERFDLPELAVA